MFYMIPIRLKPICVSTQAENRLLWQPAR